MTKVALIYVYREVRTLRLKNFEISLLRILFKKYQKSHKIEQISITNIKY